jgi:hypothetical protein
MATQTKASADAILKDLYVGPVVEQINKKTWLLDQIERDSDHIDHTGRRAVIPLHTSRNRGRGSRGDAGTLPVAGQQGYADAIVPIKYHYSGIEISDGAIEASTSNEGAFLNLLNAETKGCAEDMRKDMQRQVYGTGDGLLATVKATAEETKTIELDSVQYIAVGDPVDVLVKATGEKGEGIEAVSVVKREGGSTKKVELSEKVKKATTSYGVYVAGNRSNEINGLRNIIDKGRTLHDINSATAGNEYWNATVRDVGASATETAVAGETVFEELADDIGPNGEIDVFLTSRGVRRRLADTYQSQKRFNDAQAVKIHGGYTAIFVNEIPVIADDDAPRGYVFGINKDSFRWFEQTAPGWLDRDGGILKLKDGATAGTKVAVWQGWFRWYVNLGNTAPNRNGVLRYATDNDPA